LSETFLLLRTERRKGRGVHRDSVGKPEEKSHWGDPGVNGRIIIRLIFRKWGMNWVGPVQDTDRWRALVKAVMNFRVP
jgi:hypothetical protein